MIMAASIALVLFLQVLVARPVLAVSLAECEAWLCLPAGFSTHGGSPANACAPAHAAVLRRLRLHLDPLPPWSSCAAQFDWDAANLAWTFPINATCPHGGSLNGAGMCSGVDGDGCAYTYPPREHGNVWVWVNGAQTGSSLPYTLANAGSPTKDPRSCPPDMPDSGEPPQVVGPPASSAGNAGAGGVVGGGGGFCNTIGCPHVQHTWGAAPLNIRWTLRTAPPVPKP